MNNAEDTVFDIVIVGGGLVGASMACLLENSNLRVALVDRVKFDTTTLPLQQSQPAFDPRVSALTAASMRMLTELGVWNDITRARLCEYQQMLVWDADGTGSIEFTAAAINQPALGVIVENSIVLAALYAKIATLPNVELIAPFAIDELVPVQNGDGNQVRLLSDSGQFLNARLLVAADGGNSRVRELANFTCKEWDYKHQALVTTVRTELPHRHTAWQRFMQTGPLAFLPLLPQTNSTDEHYCSIVWSSVPGKTAALMQLPDTQFNIELAAAIENRLGAVLWSDRRFAFPLTQRHATQYVKDNIVLVGDAAHTIHPLAGQGVNLGFLDVQSLVKELQHGLSAGRTVTDPIVLQRFQRQRRGHNLGMMWLMEGFKHVFAEQALPIRWLRNFGMKQIDNLPLVKNQLARRAMGLDQE